RKAAQLFDADQAVVALKSEGDDHLVIRAGYQLVPGELGHAVALGEGAIGLASAKREGILVNDYASWSGRVHRASNPPFIETIRATISYPLLIRGELIGALAVAYVGGEDRRFVPEDLDRLATLAAPAPLAIPRLPPRSPSSTAGSSRSSRPGCVSSKRRRRSWYRRASFPRSASSCPAWPTSSTIRSPWSSAMVSSSRARPCRRSCATPST